MWREGWREAVGGGGILVAAGPGGRVTRSPELSKSEPRNPKVNSLSPRRHQALAPPPLAKTQASAQTLLQLRQPSLPHSTSSSCEDTAQGAPPPREDFPQSQQALCRPTTWVRISALLLDSYVSWAKKLNLTSLICITEVITVPNSEGCLRVSM